MGARENGRTVLCFNKVARTFNLKCYGVVATENAFTVITV